MQPRGKRQNNCNSSHFPIVPTVVAWGGLSVRNEQNDRIVLLSLLEETRQKWHAGRGVTIEPARSGMPGVTFDTSAVTVSVVATGHGHACAGDYPRRAVATKLRLDPTRSLFPDGACYPKINVTNVTAN